MYRYIFEKSADAMLIFEENKLVDCNNSAIEILKYKNREQLLNVFPSDLSPKCQPDGKSSYYKVEDNPKSILKNNSRTFEWLHLRADGEPFWVEVALTNISENDKVTFLAVLREINQRKKLEEKNIHQQILFASILNSNADPIFYKKYSSGNSKYIECNKSFENLVGKSKKEIIGHNDIELFGKEFGEFFRKKDLDVIKNEVDIVSEEWVIYPNSNEVLLRIQRSILKDENENIIGIMGISKDITSEHSYKVKLEKSMKKRKLLAEIDPLTHTHNRTSFFNISEKLVKVSFRKGIHLSLMMIDIDSLKSINDAYGHTIGDDILQYVADTIKNRLRDSDLISHYNSGEFMVLLSDADLGGAVEVAEDIRLIFFNNNYSDDKLSIPIPVQVSIGVSQYKNEKLLQEFVKRVESALYKAKINGRNRVEAN